MATIGREDLGSDPALADNAGRVKRVAEIDAAIGEWTRTRSVDQCCRCWTPRVPAGRIYTVADIAADPHYAARGMLQDITLDDGDRSRAGHRPQAVPHPGAHQRNAPAIGQDTDAVMRELGLTPEQIAALKSRGVKASE